MLLHLSSFNFQVQLYKPLHPDLSNNNNTVLSLDDIVAASDYLEKDNRYTLTFLRNVADMCLFNVPLY